MIDVSPIGATKIEFREFSIDRGRASEDNGFSDNSIITSRYTISTFLPKNLYRQFQRIGILWFIFISILQILPLSLSPMSEWSTIAPFCVILFISMAKDAYSDYRNHQNDRRINTQLAKIWSESANKFIEINWSKVEVGHILLISMEELVPADCVLLRSSSETCYLETSSLDGEDNLKVKIPLQETASLFDGHSPMGAMAALHYLDDALVKTEQSKNRFHQFGGSLKMKNNPRRIEIEWDNMVLRGSRIKNTEWVLALVAYTGVDTKILQNTMKIVTKRSRVDRKLNYYIGFLFIFVLAITILLGTLSIIFSYDHSDSYKFHTGKSSDSSFLVIISLFILFYRFVPISAYLTIDIVKIFQAKLINWDQSLRTKESTAAPKVNNYDSADDLGQIEYIFADKTGTLTFNQMEFKKCSIKGRIFESKESILSVDKTQEICDFLEALALCHTVIPEERSGVTIYEAASQDEEALVQTAHALGYKFISNSNGYYTLNVNNENLDYRVLGINELTSERKRMSILIEPMSERNRGPVLYCKGADSVMLERCLANSSTFKDSLNHLESFALSGLRTLIYARKELTYEEAEDFSMKYITSKNALYDKSKRLAEIAEEIERDMEILGVSAIEDKLHEGVSETIGNLMKAGIKICILTGDKPETAVNIAYSTRLFNPDLSVINLSASSEAEVESLMVAALKNYLFYPNKQSSLSVYNESRKEVKASSFERIINATSAKLKKEKLNIKPIPKRQIKALNLGITVDGNSIAFILANQQLQKYLIILLSVSQAAIFGRLTPQQKAEIVRFVKNSFIFKPCVLAVGDGANDVAMLQEADVGVGILGNEGSQASNSSDFAVSNFYLLDKLILYQGRWAYYRLSKVILYSLYKNLTLSLPLFYYAFYSDYSAQGLYDSILLSVFNLLFTSVPVVVLGVFDKDLDRDEIRKNPESYQIGMYNRRFGFKQVLWWTVIAIAHSVFLFFFTYQGSSSVSPSGRTEDIYILGTFMYLAIILTVSLTILFEMQHCSVLVILSVLLSIALIIPFLTIYSSKAYNNSEIFMKDIGSIISGFSALVISNIFTPIACILQSILIKVLFNQLKQSSTGKLHQTLYQVTENSELLLKRAINCRKNLPKLFMSNAQKPDTTDEEMSFDKLNKYTLKFSLQHIERSYLVSQLERNVSFFTKVMRISAAIYGFATILELSLSTNSSVVITIRVITLAFLLTTALLASLKFVQKHYNTFIVITFSTTLLLKHISEIATNRDGTLGFIIMLPLVYFYLYSCTYSLFFPTCIYLISHLIWQIIVYSSSNYWLLLHYISLISPFVAMIIFIGHSLEKCNRMDYVLNKKLEYKFQKGHDILGNLLPGFVKERVKQGIRYIADYQSNVTVLFCDICDFDRICALHSPNELLELLDRFFGVLDQLCDKHGVTKIETVNKTYMVCSGLKDSEEHIPSTVLSHNHATRCLDLAIEIIEKIEKVYLKTGEKLKVKIGITSGPVIAGVVGEHKPQFSLVGDTVNTASRMCTTLMLSDSIQLSESTFKLINRNKYKIKESNVFVKGKGYTKTFVATALGKRTRNRRMATIEKSVDDISDRTSIDIPASDIRMDVEIEKFPQSNKIKLEEFHFSKEDDSEIDLVGPIQWIVCSLYESKAQNELRIGIINMEGKNLRVGLTVFSAFYVIISMVFIADFVITGNKFAILIGISRAICLFLLIANLIYFKKTYKSPLFPWFTMSLLILASFISSLNLQIVDSSIIPALLIEKMYLFVITSHLSGLLFGFILGSFTADLTTFMIVLHFSPSTVMTKLSCLLTISLFYVIELLCSLFIEHQERKRFNINKLANREIKNTEKLLNQMIPTQVLRNLHHDITTTDRYFDVTIIYADICGFTSWSSTKEPIEVVSMLSKLFSNFDHLCVRHHVYKVHTIGDCYVILSFTDGERRDIAKECVNMVEIALDMIKVIKKVNKRQKTELNMRIGMHTGEVVAGITGTNIVRYDIYGPDVEIANKTESNGIPGKINVSQVTQNLLEIYQPGRFEFEFNKGIVHEPTNRELNCYFLSQKP